MWTNVAQVTEFLRKGNTLFRKIIKLRTSEILE